MYSIQTMTSSLTWHTRDVNWNISKSLAPVTPPISSEIQYTGSINESQQAVEVSIGSKGQLLFTPESISAPFGTVITFELPALNRSLTQTSLRNPCLNNNGSANGSDTKWNWFYPSNNSGKYTIEYRIQSNKPEWFFCMQPLQCGTSMVFNVNPLNISQDLNHQNNQTMSHYWNDTSSRPANYCHASYPTTNSGIIGIGTSSIRSSHGPLNTSGVVRFTNNGLAIRYPIVLVSLYFLLTLILL
jgi:hypothetical protein